MDFSLYDCPHFHELDAGIPPSLFFPSFSPTPWPARMMWTPFFRSGIFFARTAGEILQFSRVFFHSCAKLFFRPTRLFLR